MPPLFWHRPTERPIHQSQSTHAGRPLQICLSIPSRGRRLSTGLLAAEEQGKHGKDRDPRRVISSSNQGRNIETGVGRRVPRNGWPDDETPGWIAANSFISETRELHFCSHLEPFVGQ